jgi:hypothetical protein
VSCCTVYFTFVSCFKYLFLKVTYSFVPCWIPLFPVETNTFPVKFFRYFLRVQCPDTFFIACLQNTLKIIIPFLISIHFCFSHSKFLCFLTVNVPVVYMARDVMILMGENPFRGLLEGAGPENQDFWALKWRRAKWFSRFSGPSPSNGPSNGFAPSKSLRNAVTVSCILYSVLYIVSFMWFQGHPIQWSSLPLPPFVQNNLEINSYVLKIQLRYRKFEFKCKM